MTNNVFASEVIQNKSNYYKHYLKLQKSVVLERIVAFRRLWTGRKQMSRNEKDQSKQGVGRRESALFKSRILAKSVDVGVTLQKPLRV